MRVLIMLLGLMLCLACAYDCDSEMDKARRKHGPPEEVTSYSSGNYYSESWWYWRQGINYTFTLPGSKPCEVSVYTFTPIGKSTGDERALVDSTKVLLYTTRGRRCLVCPE